MYIHSKGLRGARLEMERKRVLPLPPERMRRAVRRQRKEALEKEYGLDEAVHRRVGSPCFGHVAEERAHDGRLIKFGDQGIAKSRRVCWRMAKLCDNRAANGLREAAVRQHEVSCK